MFAEHKPSWILTGTVVAFIMALYVPGVQRTVAHPPGYPIFTLLAHLGVRLLPLSPAHSVNLMNSLLGAAASGFLCLTVCRLVGPGPGAVLAGGLFAVSKLSWQWSMVAEVFTLNNLFVGLLFYLTVSFHCAQTPRQRWKTAQWGALCCGLGLCNQHTLVLYVLGIIPWVIYRLHSLKELSLNGLVYLGLCFLAGFLPYIYLPISSYLNTARWSWGDQTTMSGLLTHLLRTEYGTFSLVLKKSQILDYFRLCFCRACRPISWLLAAMLLIYSLFFAWRANLDISRPLLLGVVERFWLQSNAAVCVLAGIGLSRAQTVLQRRVGYERLWRTVSWGECDQRNNTVIERFGRELLASVPKDSLILTRGDLPGNSMRYLHYCEGVRPDVRLVDQEMMTYPWYVAKLSAHLPGVHFPGHWWDPVQHEDKNTFSLEQFLSHNTKDVFACIGLPDGDLTWEHSFARWPFGVCDYLVPVHRAFHPEQWAQRTRTIYKWREPHNSFHPASWERVANEEMWQARMKTAFFLFDLAESMEGEARARLFELSYTLYREIVDVHSSYPPNWDKNLALACERLLRSGQQGHSPDSLLTCSAQHFSLYLEKEPTDPQAPAIRSAITHLLKEKERLRQTRTNTR
uniref:Transmembrane protein 260 n=1 Tax=Oryzias latipes TaxID=8090 RepID=H2MNF3_ORYLA